MKRDEAVHVILLARRMVAAERGAVNAGAQSPEEALQLRKAARAARATFLKYVRACVR